MLAHIENLRDIAECCSRGDQLDPELACWLSNCLKIFLSERTNHMDELSEFVRRGEVCLGELNMRCGYAMPPSGR